MLEIELRKTAGKNETEFWGRVPLPAACLNREGVIGYRPPSKLRAESSLLPRLPPDAVLEQTGSGDDLPLFRSESHPAGEGETIPPRCPVTVATTLSVRATETCSSNLPLFSPRNTLDRSASSASTATMSNAFEKLPETANLTSSAEAVGVEERMRRSMCRRRASSARAR